MVRKKSKIKNDLINEKRRREKDERRVKNEKRISNLRRERY
jgi:hypothetical protein